MVFIGGYAPAPLLRPFIQAKETGFINRTDVACLYHQDKDHQIRRKQGHSELGCSNNTDLGPKKIAFFFPLPVQLTNIYSGPVIYSASCFSPGLLCQGLPLIGISPDEAAFGGQSCAEDPCLEGPGSFTHWAKTLALQFSSSVTVAK